LQNSHHFFKIKMLEEKLIWYIARTFINATMYTHSAQQ
jgi:hypothetical protein